MKMGKYKLLIIDFVTQLDVIALLYAPYNAMYED